MKRTQRFAVVLTSILLLAMNLHAQSQHTNNARGFNANGAYASYDIDHINLFNGNLLITIPIGQRYPVNGNLSYQFNLVYNSFIWSYESTCSGSTNERFSESYGALTTLQRGVFCNFFIANPSSGTPCWRGEYEEAYTPPFIDPEVFVVDGGDTRKGDRCQSFTTINQANNAGVGWQVHLGKLFRPRDDVREGLRVSTERLHEVYQSPDGSDHEFFGTLHEGEDEDGNPDNGVTELPDYYYTRDNSYLRMWRNPNPSVAGNYTTEPPDGYVPEYSYIIWFPNGEKHYFQRIRIQNAFRLEGSNVINFNLSNYEDKLVRIEDQFGNYVTLDYYDDESDDDDGDSSTTGEGELKDNVWKIRDSVGRTHVFKFTKSGSATLIDSIDLENVDGARDTYDLRYALDQSVDVAKPHALKGFGITDLDFVLPGYTHTSEQDATMLLPFLIGVELPDHSEYSMPFASSYRPYASNNGALAAGALVQIRLPTGGRIQWDYHLPDDATDGFGYFFSQGSSGRSQARVAPGIRKRRVYLGAGETSLVGEWKYDPKLSPTADFPGCVYANLIEPCGSYDIINKVTEPTGDYTEYFFSVYPFPGRRNSPPLPDPTHRALTDAHIADYGLPFSKDPRYSIDPAGPRAMIADDDSELIPGTPANTPGKPLFISSIQYAANGTPLRKHYVRYEGDTYTFSDGFSSADQYNPRLVAMRTQYLDDDPIIGTSGEKILRYSEVQYSDFDGLGHYRRMDTFGNLGNDRRTEITNYNPLRGTYLVDPVNNSHAPQHSYTVFHDPDKWILNTYDKQAVVQFNKQSTTYFRFNPKGQLKGKRVRRLLDDAGDETLAANDVLVNYDYDGKGNLISESYFGGDRLNHVALGTDENNPAYESTQASEYHITYTYQCQMASGGTSTTSTVSQKYFVVTGDDVKLIENVIDCSTGVVKSSKDSAQVETQYIYGVMGRLTDVKRKDSNPNQNLRGNHEQIIYNPFIIGGNATPSVTVNRWKHKVDGSVDTKDLDNLLGQESYEYDGLGRLVKEIRLLPENVRQARNTRYNERNWVLGVSEWVPPSLAILDGKETVYGGYDAFGRPGTITAPDGKQTTMLYKGVREVSRTVSVGTGISAAGKITNQNSITTEVYDRHGRLTEVLEPSKQNGNNASWSYTYNVNGQMILASANDPARSPGNQIRTFEYDNLGNLLTQSLPERGSSTFSRHDTMGNVGKTSDGKNSVTLGYDGHGRIIEIRDDSVAQKPLIKSFSYYVRNDVDANGNSSAGNKGFGKMSAATRYNRITNPYEVENAALNKAATQSSTWGGFAASLANDGNTNGNYFSHTNPDPQAWWQVDLGSNRAIEQVKVWNRTDSATERLTDFYVLVSDNPMPTSLAAARAQAGVSSYHVSGKAGTPTTVNVGRTGQYVRVQLNGTNYLTPAEVEVMASPTTLLEVPVTEEYTYAGMDGRLSRQVTKLNGNYTFNQTFAYDQLGNLSSQTYPQCTNSNCLSSSNTGGNQSRPWTVHYGYKQGRLSSVGPSTDINNNSYAKSIGYNVNGTLNTIVHGNDVVDTVTMDPNNMQRPAQIQSKKGTAAPLWDSGSYQYDGSGNITRIGPDWYLYDRVNRVVEGTAMGAQKKKNYSYDVFGNILSVTTYDGVTGPSTAGTQVDLYQPGIHSGKNQYTLNYDAAGNLVGVMGEGGQPPPPTYGYDSMNMIKTAQGPGVQLTHLYGPDDERVWTIEKRIDNLISSTEPSQPPPTMAINDASISEGNSGTVNVVFTVSLSAASGSTVTVNYATANSTAVAGSDYTAANATLTFGPGETTKNITVTVTGDTAVENNETFFVNLSAPANATIADGQGLGTIINDDTPPLPTGLVGQWKFDENAGTTVVDSSGYSQTGTLTGGASWAIGQSAAAVSLDGVDDYVQVGGQSSLTMTNAATFAAWIYPTGAGSGGAAGSGGIIINKEGEFEIARFGDGTIRWAFANSSPGWVWTSSGSVAPLNQWTHVAIVYDAGVVKTYVNGTLIHSLQGSGAIGDSAPTQNDFRIGGRQYASQYFQGRIDECRVYRQVLSASEIGALVGTAPSPNLAQGKPATQSSTYLGIAASVAVDGNTNGNYFSHTNSDAQAWWQVDLGSRYAINQVKIWNRTDCCAERLTNFSIKVSDTPFDGTAPVYSTPFAGQAGSPSVISLNSTGRYVRVQLAGTNYLSLAEVEVFGNLAPPAPTPTPTPNGTNVALASNGGVATASSTTPATDFPGMEFYPSAANDGSKDGYNNPHNTYWRDGTNDIWPDWLQVEFNSSKTITEIDVFTTPDNVENNPGNPTEATTFTLYGITTFDVQYWNGASWVVVPGGSVSGNNKVWRKFTFAPLTTNKIRVYVYAAQSNVIANTRSRIMEVEAYGTATPASLTLNDVTVSEGSSGTNTSAVFTVSLSPASTNTVTVNYATANDMAVAGSDYTATSGTLTFSPGQTSKTISVPIIGDSTVESDETFFVNLSAPSNAVLADGFGEGTISNDDLSAQPALTINDISVPEGNTGLTNFTFTVTLLPTSSNTVTVNYATASGTAVAGSDYYSANNTLTFSPGQTSKTISVTVVADTVVEANETFYVNLSNATNAVITDSQGVAFINNDDVAPAPTPMPTRLWSFDENGGEIAADTSGTGQHFGYLQNGARWVAGLVNTGLAFDGIDDEVTTSGTDLSNNFTVSFWALPADTHQIDNESNTNIGGTVGQRYALWPTNYPAAGEAGAGISVGTNGVSVYEHSSGYMPALLVYPTPVDRWTHVVVVYENRQPKLYLNGNLVRTGLASPKSVVHFNPAQIGGGSYGHYAGALDDLRVFDRALNDTEVKSLVVPPGSPGLETVWIEDSLPAGANTAGSDESWNWIQSNPAPVTGSSSHQSSINSQRHQHLFTGATNTLSIGTGDVMFAWVYLDPANPPREIMLQWNVNGSWDQRAYWGEDLIAWGTNMSDSRRPVGYLPAAGQWVRLEVPAKSVGLEGKTVNGMAFTLSDGRATWDRIGKYSRLFSTVESSALNEDLGEGTWPSSLSLFDLPFARLTRGAVSHHASKGPKLGPIAAITSQTSGIASSSMTSKLVQPLAVTNEEAQDSSMSEAASPQQASSFATASAPNTSVSAAVIVERITLRGRNNEVLREYEVTNGDAPNHWRWIKDYIYAGSKLLASEAAVPGGASVEIRQYHLDHLGTPRVISNTAGASVGNSPYQYFPFGDEAVAPPANERLRFTGHERDSSDPFQLDYMHARYYFRGGGAGKFMSVDPGKDWDPKEPQSWNLYAYARNNPLGRTDPTGRYQISTGFWTSVAMQAEKQRGMIADEHTSPELASYYRKEAWNSCMEEAYDNFWKMPGSRHHEGHFIKEKAKEGAKIEGTVTGLHFLWGLIGGESAGAAAAASAETGGLAIVAVTAWAAIDFTQTADWKMYRARQSYLRDAIEECDRVFGPSSTWPYRDGAQANRAMEIRHRELEAVRKLDPSFK